MSKSDILTVVELVAGQEVVGFLTFDPAPARAPFLMDYANVISVSYVTDLQRYSNM